MIEIHVFLHLYKLSANVVVAQKLAVALRSLLHKGRYCVFRPKRWNAISAQESNNRGLPEKVLQETNFTFQIAIFPAQALESHVSLRIQKSGAV